MAIEHADHLDDEALVPIFRTFVQSKVLRPGCAVGWGRGIMGCSGRLLYEAEWLAWVRTMVGSPPGLGGFT